MIPPNKENSFRPDIQGLRALAVSVVVLAHANVPGFSGGFVGVDIFFVISGFLITGLLVTERLDSGAIHYGKFLVRRLRRLFPALLVMLVIVQVLSWLLLSNYEALMQTGSFLYAATWTSNFYFTFAEFNYFAVLQSKDLYLHTWSLGIEEQFYLIWPWLVILSFTIGGTSSARASKYLVALIMIVIVSSLGLSLYWTKGNPLLSFYMMPSRGWQFALGASVYLYLQGSGAARSGGFSLLSSDYAAKVVGLLGLLMILGSTFFLHAKLTYPGYYALIPSVGTALLLLAGAGGKPSMVNASLSSKAFVWLGDRSYSIYLWHWPVLLLGGAYRLSDTVVGIAGLILISVVFAMLSYRYIERPFWKGEYSGISVRTTVLASGLAVLALVGTSNALIRDVFTGTPSPFYKSATENRSGAPGVDRGSFGCDSWYHSAKVVPCTFGDPDAQHTAVLIGDSVGVRWGRILPEIYEAPGWRFLVLTKSGCAIVDVEYFYKAAGGKYDVCTQWRAASMEYIQELKPDVVFVGSSAYYDFSESQWIEGTESVVQKLTVASDHVVIFPGNPALSFNGPSCIKEPYRFTMRLRDSKYMCEEKMASPVSIRVAGYLEQAVTNTPNAHVLNLNNLVCPGQRCAARTKDGVTVYADNVHLHASFVRSTMPVIRTQLDLFRVGPSFLTTKETGRLGSF